MHAAEEALPVSALVDVPRSQSSQLVLPAPSEYVPASQLVQLADPIEPEYLPPAHERHRLAEEWSEALVAGSVRYLPVGQVEQAMLEALSLNLPSLHTTQAPLS